MPHNIILMHISNVSGHKQATQAVTNAIKQLDPGANVISLNAFNYTNPVSEKIINSIYMGVIKSIPTIWRYLYDNPKIVRNTNGLKEMVHRSNAPKLKALFDKFPPDAIACSQAFPCGMVAYFKKIYGSNIPLIGILTDYTDHSYWIYDTVDSYIVPSESVKNSLIKRGILEKRIHVLGIPIEPKFSIKHPPAPLRDKFGLSREIPVVLIMGGGQGLGPMVKITELLDKSTVEFQTIVVCGTNRKLYQRLSSRTKNFRKKTMIMEFSNDIDQLMSLANLLITKPGGITTAEALAKGVPMLIIKPIPGQEESNTRFLLDNGAAVKLEKISELPDMVSGLLSDHKKLKEMSEKALAVSKPQSSLNIARLILDLCNNRLTQK